MRDFTEINGSLIFTAPFELKQASYEANRPGAIQEAIIARYSYGKDLTSKYKTLIPKLTAASVDAFLKDLAESGKVEYIVTK